MWSVRDTETNRILFTARNKKTKRECIRELIEYLSPDLDTSKIIKLPAKERDELIRNFGYEVFNHNNPIIHVDDLVEKAWSWWELELQSWERENVIIGLYMTNKGIRREEVDW